MNYTSYYPSPPPYGQFAAPWYHHGNQGGFENAGSGPTGPNVAPQGGGTVAPSQNQNQNDNIQHEVMSLREELVQLRAEQARNNRHPPTPPPRYNRIHSRTNSTTANLQLPNPPPVHTITTAISPHESSIDNQFEDLLYVTQDEKIAAASLLLYGPSDDLHEDCMWDSSTGACVLVGNSLQQIQERNRPIVLPPPNPDMGNPIMDANPDSAVAAAEARMGEAHQPSNFNALWVAREMAWQAQRTLYQEQDLGILCECSTLPALLAAHLQIFNEQKIDWVDKLIITFEGEPWNTEQDCAKPEVPSFPTPDLNESTEIWALWCIVHANIRDHPGITWTHSDFVDLATVQMHLILHRLIRGIFGTVDFYTERLLPKLWDLDLSNVEPRTASPLPPITLGDVHPPAQSLGTYPPGRIPCQELTTSRLIPIYDLFESYIDVLASATPITQYHKVPYFYQASLRLRDLSGPPRNPPQGSTLFAPATTRSSLSSVAVPVAPFKLQLAPSTLQHKPSCTKLYLKAYSDPGLTPSLTFTVRNSVNLT
ncbi:hypothetical protein EV359DRAFT_80654 [Lentinula novae-zelandiae]|nr:hypothetical protein EV359DRAFT_80654 [Lentinula novae-zelandiae]